MSFRTLKMILTLHCDESSRLLSSGLDRELTLAERIALAGHRLTCKHCRRLRDQIEFLRQVIRHREVELSEPTTGPTSGGLSPRLSIEARQRIQAILDRSSPSDK